MGFLLCCCAAKCLNWDFLGLTDFQDFCQVNSAGIFLPGQNIGRAGKTEILQILIIPKIPVQTFSVKLILRESF